MCNAHNIQHMGGNSANHRASRLLELEENKMNAVQSLIKNIEVKAAEKGLFLHRYQSNKGKFSYIITYALHSSAERPAKSAACDGDSVQLSQCEGTTERCEAYRQLSELLTVI